MHEIAHGLDPLPPEPRLAEQIPGDRGQMIRLTVPAAEQVHEGVVRKRFDRVLLGVTRHGLGFAAVVDERVRRQPKAPGRCDDTAAPVTKAVAIHLHRHRRIGDQVVGSHQIRCARVVHVQRQDHRRELLALVDQFVPQSYLHVFLSALLHVGRACAVCVRRRCPRLPRWPPLETLPDASPAPPRPRGAAGSLRARGDRYRASVRRGRRRREPTEGPAYAPRPRASTVPHVATPHQRRRHGAPVSRVSRPETVDFVTNGPPAVSSPPRRTTHHR